MAKSKAPTDVRAAFARRLLNARVKKGLNQSELARAAAIHSGTFGRDSISKYEKGLHLPTPIQLDALAKALNVPPSELLPQNPGIAEVMEPGMRPAFRTIDDDTMWLRVNQAVPRELGMKIIAMLEGGE
jgi:transcriptional regulator with XRE-family HTH domain